MRKLPVIFGISGLKLTDEEKELFIKAQPYGFILFARNIDTKEQIKNLTASLKATGQNEAPVILIDQEIGRVTRIKPPLMKAHDHAEQFGKLAQSDLSAAKSGVYNAYKEIGLGLKELGFDVDCAPVADLYYGFADKIIGQRSFGANLNIVTELCKSACEGLKDAGIEPVIKHVPGHGRANCDSHLTLPTVDTPLDELEKTDFAIFKNIAKNSKYAMTAHVLFTALDSDKCVTLSSKAMTYIRENLGLKENIIMSDDLCMKALQGTPQDLAIEALNAGLDLVLHCNGSYSEMLAIYEELAAIN